MRKRIGGRYEGRTSSLGKRGSAATSDTKNWGLSSTDYTRYTLFASQMFPIALYHSVFCTPLSQPACEDEVPTLTSFVASLLMIQAPIRCHERLKQCRKPATFTTARACALEGACCVRSLWRTIDVSLKIQPSDLIYGLGRNNRCLEHWHNDNGEVFRTSWGLSSRHLLPWVLQLEW